MVGFVNVAVRRVERSAGRSVNLCDRVGVRMAAVGSEWGRSATEQELKTSLPQLYVYDHCPFCVKCRMAFGLRNEKYDLVFFANDDVVNPTKLIGKKVLPILEKDGKAMGESADIVNEIEKDGPILKPKTGREDVAAWLKEYAGVQRKLTRPRLAATPLAEFQTQSSRDMYAKNHPLPDGSSYEEAMEQTPALLAEFNEALKKLDEMIYSEESVSEGGVGWDDLDLFPRLRGFTMVKGIELPSKLKAYAENMSKKTDVPLFYYCAS